MNEITKRNLDLVIKFAACTNFKGSFVISKQNNTFAGIDIRFDPPLNLDDFPSIKHAMEVLGK